MKKLLVSAALLSTFSLSALAEETTENIVLYNAKRGFAETFSVSQTEQLGKFRVVLEPIKSSYAHDGKKHDGKKHDKKKHGAKKTVLIGVIKGRLNPDFTLEHIFINDERTGAIYTASDGITTIYSGDPTCENGAGTAPFEVEETLNIVAGTGVYAGVEPGSFIVLKGMINNCPSLAEFGQNNFEVVGGTVTITQ